MSSRTRLTLRVTAIILLVLAATRFVFDVVSSLHTEDRALQGGFQIDHTVEINHWTVALALAGGLVLALSFVIRASKSIT